jgi:hypothetical protein
MKDIYYTPQEMLLGTRSNARVPEADQQRQKIELKEILHRLRTQPGVILADEVGMGKTFVALAVAYSVARHSLRGPVIVMVPANLIDKWVQDLKTFCELYLENRRPVQCDKTPRSALKDPAVVRYGVARHSIELMKLLDDPPRERCHFIFLAQGAMSRRQTDKWLRLALIAKALNRHGRGKANRLIQVKKQIHRFLAKLLWAIGEEHASDEGNELWQSLLRVDPEAWKAIYNNAVRDERRQLTDDPVPKAVLRALERIDSTALAKLAEALKQMPVRARGGDERVAERLNSAREALRQVEDILWKDLLTQARWRSPLLVMDEAHHLKNPGTSLARQLQSIDSEQDLRTGDGAMAKKFDRMLFLTATPFQLGHHELVQVLQRFGDIRWDSVELGDREEFSRQLEDLRKCLNESQRTAIALQRSWGRLRPEDCDSNVDDWWKRLLSSPHELLTSHQRAVVDAYESAKLCRDTAQKALSPWILRYNKGTYWAGTVPPIPRRHRIEGAAIAGFEFSTGLPIPPQQLLPFFLAARSAVDPGKDLLGEALCSSYEAFRYTRLNGAEEKDQTDSEESETAGENDNSNSQWYLREFDRSLEYCTGAIHPKINATVRKVVDLWETGEKVLVFAFYRHTCRALRIHISREIENRVMETGINRLRTAGIKGGREEVERLLERIQRRFFDEAESTGRRAVDAALEGIIITRTSLIGTAGIDEVHKEHFKAVMRSFLRVPTTLVRCFPITTFTSIPPEEAVQLVLDFADASGLTWRRKFSDFIDFLTNYCSGEEREAFLEAAQRTQTGGIRLGKDEDEEDDIDSDERSVVLPNVREATGKTKRDIRSRLMRAFNTPFFPDILVCSQVMGEGVDLQRFCRHVIHHDLAWNPSTIEQRTGRIDRLGCKAEGRQPVVLYLPYLEGTADERQFRVMSDREQWFRVVMGQDEVARLITPESCSAIPLPEAISEGLSFKLNTLVSGR